MLNSKTLDELAARIGKAFEASPAKDIEAAIKVLKSKAVLPGHLPQLIAAIKPAVVVAEKTKTGDLLVNAVTENVRRQVAQLKRSPPIVQKLYAAKKIDIVGGVYDLATGKVALV
jgi:carbonic anhydrase